MELSDGPCLIGLDVLQIETAHQEVLAPDVLRHQVHLEINSATEKGAEELVRNFIRMLSHNVPVITQYHFIPL